MNQQTSAIVRTKPDFIIIGAMKCATSTIHDQLARHDGISMSEPKEPNFFSDEENWNRGLGWYGALFESMPEADIKGESSTHYTKLPTYRACADRLYAQLPNVKLVYVMRDPVDRLVSQFIHEWSVRTIPDSCSIDQAVRAFPELLAYSRYAMQLEPYVERYGREGILPVFFERLMAGPQEELERIARFIGYEHEVKWIEGDAKNVSSQRQRRSPMLNAVLNLRLTQTLRRTLMPESLRAKIRSRWTMKERPALSQESIAWIHEQLDPDMTALGSMLGVALSCAGFKDCVRSGPMDWTDRGAGDE